MLKDTLKVTCPVTFTLTKEDGTIEKFTEENLVTSAGLTHIANSLIGTTTPVSHMAIGSGTTAADVSQTTLVTEIERLALGSSALITTNIANDTVQYTAVFGAGVATGVITEAGLFNAATEGTMTNRIVFNEINKDVNDSLTIEWRIVIS
jgi:hypothetical protein